MVHIGGVGELERETQVTPSGATRSERARGFRLIPVTALQREAARMDLGAKVHGEYNWHRGVSDPEFVRASFDHLMEHVLKWRSGQDRADDHLAAIRCGAAFLMVIEERHPEAIREALREI